MLPYLGIMIGLVSAGLLAPRRFGLPLRLVAFIVLLVFCGARVEVGPDWFSYEIYHNYLVLGYSQLSILSEPSFLGISLLSERLGYGIIGVNFIAALVYLVGLFWLASKTPFPWCALAVAFCYYVPALPMGIIRQAAAVGIVLALAANIKKLTVPMRIAIVGIAMTFHLSAVVMLGVIFAALPIPLWQRAGVGIVGLLGIIVFNFNALDYFSVYNERYLVGLGGVIIETTAAALHWTIIAVPSAWFILNRHRLRQQGFDSDFMFVSSVFSLSLIMMFPISTAAVTRLALYFSYVPIYVAGVAPALYLKNSTSILTRIGIFLASMSILSVWLMFAENSEFYKPYRNFIWEPNSVIESYLK
jgi:EpsG family